MASLRKRGRVWYFSFIDQDGRPSERKGCPDKRVTEELARAAESEAARIKAGLVDTKELARIVHSGHPLEDHFPARPIGRNQTGTLDRLRNTKRLRPSVLPSLTILLKKQDFPG